jgi:hypothetical protein
MSAAGEADARVSSEKPGPEQSVWAIAAARNDLIRELSAIAASTADWPVPA